MYSTYGLIVQCVTYGSMCNIWFNCSRNTYDNKVSEQFKDYIAQIQAMSYYIYMPKDEYMNSTTSS